MASPYTQEIHLQNERELKQVLLLILLGVMNLSQNLKIRLLSLEDIISVQTR